MPHFARLWHDVHNKTPTLQQTRFYMMQGDFENLGISFPSICVGTSVATDVRPEMVHVQNLAG
jgi:hypothetical protein